MPPRTHVNIITWICWGTILPMKKQWRNVIGAHVMWLTELSLVVAVAAPVAPVHRDILGHVQAQITVDVINRVQNLV